MPYIIYGGIVLVVTATKIALDANHRKTVEVETDSICRMKTAGVSDEIINGRIKAWEEARRKNEAFITVIVKPAEMISNMTQRGKLRP